MNKSLNKGQTLVEVLVALTILIMVMVAAFTVLFSSLSFTLSSREETQAISKMMEVSNERIYIYNQKYPLPSPQTINTIFNYTAPEEDGIIVTTSIAAPSTSEPGYLKTGFYKLTTTATITRPNPDVVLTESQIIWLD